MIVPNYLFTGSDEVSQNNFRSTMTLTEIYRCKALYKTWVNTFFKNKLIPINSDQL